MDRSGMIWRAVTCGALVLTLGSTSARAQFGGGGFGVGGFGGGGFGGGGGSHLLAGQYSNYLVGTAAEGLRRATADLKAAEEALRRAEARVTTGAATPDTVEPARARVEDLRSVVKALQPRVEMEVQFHLLTQPLQLEVSRASLPDVAKALIQATGLNLKLEAKVPADTRFSLNVQQVPLGHVVDAIARQANVMITRVDGDPRALALKDWPALEINGKRQVYRGPFAPWANEWGHVPTWAQVPGAPYTYEAPAVVPDAPPAGRPPGPPSATAPTSNGRTRPKSAPARPAPSRSTAPRVERTEYAVPYFPALAVTALPSGGFIVAEAGQNAKGESGVWLTFYSSRRGEAETPHRTVFHRTPTAPTGGDAGQTPAGGGGFGGGGGRF